MMYHAKRLLTSSPAIFFYAALPIVFVFQSDDTEYMTK